MVGDLLVVKLLDLVLVGLEEVVPVVPDQIMDLLDLMLVVLVVLVFSIV